jgi:uncharacterized protein (TIGR00730 family)
MNERLKSICLFCGSSGQVAAEHLAAAERFGRLVAEAGCRLVFGGGRIGLMGVAADACLKAGGEVFGVIPEFLDQIEVGHHDITELKIVASMHDRKRVMAELSDGFVVLPGGLGTLDETFEILTWRQLGLHQKPIVIVDQGGYWRPLRDLIDNTIQAGFAKPRVRELFIFVSDVDDALPALRRHFRPEGIIQGRRL